MSAELHAGELAPEELARANFYALLARLFYAPPDTALLRALASADPLPSDDAGAALALAWQEMSLAAATADEEELKFEYESRFVGTGKAEISLYTGAYTVKTALDNPLVEIRGFMIEHGLARREDAHEPEDHIAGLCEIMRHLIAEQHAPFDEQGRFFNSYLWPGAAPLCDAIEKHPDIGFYKQVARLAHAFFLLEHSTLDMN